jgi:arsenate reductase-like glutaredoxin family protein
MTCKKTQGYLERVGGEVTAKEEAAKIRYGPDKALGVLKDISKLVVIKGKKVTTFDLKRDRPDDETLLAHLLGPTGNLRAPTARIGSTLIVGFNEETYAELLG